MGFVDEEFAYVHSPALDILTVLDLYAVFAPFDFFSVRLSSWLVRVRGLGRNDESALYCIFVCMTLAPATRLLQQFHVDWGQHENEEPWLRHAETSHIFGCEIQVHQLL